jgi:hypothetical protein
MWRRKTICYSVSEQAITGQNAYQMRPTTVNAMRLLNHETASTGRSSSYERKKGADSLREICRE